MVFKEVNNLRKFLYIYYSRLQRFDLKGMACGLIPTYLYEVSPAALRGSSGVIQQLFLTIGIVFSQMLGFRQILGEFSKIIQ